MKKEVGRPGGKTHLIGSFKVDILIRESMTYGNYIKKAVKARMTAIKPGGGFMMVGKEIPIVSYIENKNRRKNRRNKEM